MRLDPRSTAFIFPGQGSQAVGMGKELAQAYPAARQIFEEADEVLGFPLSKLMWEGPAEELNETINTQPALYIHSMAALRVFEEFYPDFKPAYVAGHSLGELSALAAAQAMGFAEGLKLVRRRGELMKKAGEIAPGGMAAVMGLDIPALEKVCADATQGNQIVQVANDNCPGQVVISGAKPAVERAIEAVKAAGAKRAIPLAVSIAAHSPLMRSVQDEFDAAVKATAIREAVISVISNVLAKPIRTPEELRRDLTGQLTERVRWTESIRYLHEQGIKDFVEFGSGTVLIGLIKRIEGSALGSPMGTPADFETLTPKSEA